MKISKLAVLAIVALLSVVPFTFSQGGPLLTSEKLNESLTRYPDSYSLLQWALTEIEKKPLPTRLDPEWVKGNLYNIVVQDL
jgi:hypothetical protein